MGGLFVRKFDFELDEVEQRVSAGVSGDWREITVLAREVIKLKKEVNKLKNKLKKDEITDDE